MNGSKDGNDQLLRAFQESFQSQSFLPLLKEELKCKIQCRRLSKGEGEMKVQFEEQKVYQVKLVISINSMEKKKHAHRRQLVLVFSIINFFTLVKI